MADLKYGAVKVRNKAIGLNLCDVYIHRGVEAVGVMIVVGPGLTGRQFEDVVAYGGVPIGAYAEERILTAPKGGTCSLLDRSDCWSFCDT
ncbi:Alcohol dehydrogenase, C-terminal [Artemisia annua]|uniref:Alcohol dehydrogenase, C-terminal n=1 Tax=Artemisia annua TaxID=35608 RepID=A0A2U1P222_ARTAN|nr:Alcohol dehydrogenase, C-terminal [Artemisia annua]